MLALDNVKVLDLTQVLAGPFCTMMLGDLGADVIKVEAPPAGDSNRALPPIVDGVSAAFWAINRNKRSICLDLKHPEGRSAFHRLAAKADVVVENYRPGVTRRLGVDFATLTEINPALVYASISGYGQTGPLSQLGGYDPVVQAMTGLMSATGSEGGDPVKISAPLTDIGTGMMGAIGILSAYVNRLKSGRGQHVDVALFDTGITFGVWDIVNYLYTGVVPRPMGTRHRITAPTGAYLTSDGRIMISAGSERLWRRFCAVIGRPELADDPRFATKPARSEHVLALSAAIEEQTRQRPTADWLATFAQEGIPCGPVNSYDQVVKEPHVLARQMLVDLPREGGRAIRVPGFPVKLSHTPAAVHRTPPALGEHSEAVLSEFGFSAAEIAGLTQAQVIRQQGRAAT